MDETEAFRRVRKALSLEGEIRCKVCGQAIQGPCVLCASCETPHHQDCWSYGGGCSVFGCRKTEPVRVALPEKELEELRREVDRRRRQARGWRLATVALGFLMVAGVFTARRPVPPEPARVSVSPSVAPTASPPASPAPPERPATPRPSPSPSQPSPRPLARRAGAAIPLAFAYAAGHPTSPEDAVRAALSGGSDDLKVVSLALQPVGAFIVTLPALEPALHGARVRVHLALPPTELSIADLVARPVLEEWSYRGRETPLPAMGSKPLEKLDRAVWDVTALVGPRVARIAILPYQADFRVLRQLKELEARANVWMSIGEPIPPPPPSSRAFPDLAITGMKLEGQEILVYFENRGKVGWSYGQLDMKLGVDGRGPLGCANAPLRVPTPAHEAVARFRLESLHGIVTRPGPTLVEAEIDWADVVPEPDEENNVGKRELVLPEIRRTGGAGDR